MKVSTVVAAAALLALPAASAAQDTPRLSLGLGAAWTAGYAAGDSRATETSNPAVSANPLLLFAASAHADATAALVAHVGWRVARAWAIEAEAQVSRPVLSVALSQDFENAPDTMASETFTQLLVGGSVVYRGRRHTRVIPFVAGGGGYVRRVAENASTAETSPELHAGGGVEFAMSRHFALRADVRVSSLAHPIGFNTSRGYVPQALGTIVLRP